MSRSSSPVAEAAATPRTGTAALPPVVGLHGVVATFDPEQDEWSEYIERLKHYFTANEIASEDKRRDILLNAVGASTYRLIRTLVTPAKLTEISYEDIVKKAEST